MSDKIRKSEWEGFERLDFRFGDRDAILILPRARACGKDCKGKLAIYTEYFAAFPNTAIELINRGYHLAFLRNANRWGTDIDMNSRRDYIDFIADEFDLTKRTVPIGMSCGGLQAVNFAYLYPEYVSVLYLDAPVLNLISCPMGYGLTHRNEDIVNECLRAMGMTESEMLSYRNHPMDKLDVLVKNEIPVVMVYGEDDTDVAYAENGKLLVDYYENAGKGGIVKVFGKKNCGHHPHGLPDPNPIVDFVEMCQ